jgi:tetratricopeptide (TPR) repeat protein
MDPSQIDVLVQRLVADPHDEEALSSAHRAGVSDPKSYALLLERVGTQSPDPAHGAHWLSEAANVWITTLGNAHRAARVLMQAIDRDPTQSTAAERLADLYREKGDDKALVALLERRAKALAPLAGERTDVREELAEMQVELGRLWSESLQQPQKALEHLRRAFELDPSNAPAIYSAREIHKALGQWADAVALYAPELSIERDPARRMALLRDEAESRRNTGDLPGAARALARARQIDPQDHALQQLYAANVIERAVSGTEVSPQERALAADLLVGLAEAYDGEHGLAYAGGALDLQPGHDRAIQLYAHHAHALQQETDLMSRYLAYVQANPGGAVATDARRLLATSYESAGQIEDAIRMLEPLHAGDEPNLALAELYARIGQQSALRPSETSQRTTATHETPTPIHEVPTDPPESSEPASSQVTKPSAFAHGIPPESSEPAPTDPPAPPTTDPPEAAEPVTATEVTPALDESAIEMVRNEEYARQRATLSRDPAQPEALAAVLEHLGVDGGDTRARRDVLYAAAKATPDELLRRERFHEAAVLSERLADWNGAVAAWQDLVSLDGDEEARDALIRGLENLERWDEVATQIEQAARAQTDVERKIAHEKALARVEEEKRGDLGAAAAAWERVALIATDHPEDAIANAVRLFEKCERAARAEQLLSQLAVRVVDPPVRAGLLEHLGELREQLHDSAGAGLAYTDAADAEATLRRWDSAERAFTTAELWDKAGHAALAAADLVTDANERASRLSRTAEHFERSGDLAASFDSLERASEIDPSNEALAERALGRYSAAGKWQELAAYLVRRADRLSDGPQRASIRKKAADVYAEHVGDKDLSREMWSKVLEDIEDKDALDALARDALEREDFAETVRFQDRIEAVLTEQSEKVNVALRAAAITADDLDDVAHAVERYERILKELDSSCRRALQALADLHEAADRPRAAADALERELKLASDPGDETGIARRLTELYKGLGDDASAARCLEIVRVANTDDLDLLPELGELYEKTGQWTKLSELLAERIEVEADDEERSELTRKLSGVLADKLDRGDEALAVLEELAGEGDLRVRDAYVELGDRLGWPGVVASKLVEWWTGAAPGPERLARLSGAFDRFVAVGRDADAVSVACELIRSAGGDPELAGALEKLSLKIGDLNALAAAHEVLAQDLVGSLRAEELVRQAEVQFAAGAPKEEALRHGEAGLAGLSVESMEPLLARLAVVAGEAQEVADLYERQIARHRTIFDRVKALARATRVAADHGDVARAKALFDLAVNATPTPESVDVLEETARHADAAHGGDRLRRALCDALATGGQNARDGGHTRGLLARRAALLAYRDLRDVDRAFSLLGDALVARVDPESLDELDALARAVGDFRRAEAALSRALDEVSESPFVRLLLARRAELRRDRLRDRVGAASDLKKLYDLSPTEPEVLAGLSALLTELRDHRAMVQIYEDQILRRKDVPSRIELARKVAELWDGELDDPREAADAWRRVLRMSPGDPTATAGLERAKANMLRRPSPSTPPPDNEASSEALETLSDELAEVTDAEETPVPAETEKPKRSLPPPLPPRA